MNDDLRKLESRVVAAAEAALAENQVVTAVDVLLRIRWLEQVHLAEWRQGRRSSLESAIQTNPRKIAMAMRIFRAWAEARGLQPAETDYVARTRDLHPLRFSRSGEPAVEQAYRTHWLSPELSGAERERLMKQQRRPPDLVVISPLNDWACGKCGGTGGLLIMEGDGPFCLHCAGLDHLVFLPAGDAALTRRTKAASHLSAVVVRFSRARKRYERQGILVEPGALRGERE